MIEDKYYRCIPELNKECKKNNCYINGGECEMTICKKYSLKGLLEEIERLNKVLLDIKEYIEDLYDVRFTDKDKRKILDIVNKALGSDKE